MLGKELKPKREGIRAVAELSKRSAGSLDHPSAEIAKKARLAPVDTRRKRVKLADDK